ncbi:MAG TPA: hybrid sensor histidine kinase/response regulator [Verrucomicrobiae bacterium]|jgi:signal transduction histidine kinase
MSATVDPVTQTALTSSELIDAPPMPKRRGTLLVVDDEESVRMSVKLVFKDTYDLLLAEDGLKAIELAQQNDIDVAILDIRMPGMSGIEVLERLRMVRPDLEAIMLTAFETTDTIRAALRLRACDYINKPFDLAGIRSAVSQAMQRRMLESEAHSSADKVRELLTELQNRSIEEQIAKTHKDIYASILHDINGPLTVVSGFVQLLNKRLARGTQLEAEDFEFIKERLHIIERQVTNCIEIQRRYLGFLRRQTGGHDHAGVNQLLKDLEQLVRVHPGLQENEFQLAPLAGEIGVKVHGTDLIQILLNLVVNAFQCTPLPHRVEVGGEVLAAPLDLARFKDGPHDRMLNVESMDNTAPLVKLWVRDTGPGIPAEVLPKIFQSYFTTKVSGQGTGLGLNIVQRLIKEGRGALHVRTERGTGTTFTIYLPGTNVIK